MADADANAAATEATDIAAEMGLSRDAVDAVMQRMRDGEASRPESIIGWVRWLFDVLTPHAESVLAITRLDDAKAYFGPAPNPARRPTWSRDALRTLEAVLLAWMKGETLQTLEKLFVAGKRQDPKCSRARRFALQVTRDLGYLAALPARLVAREIVPAEDNVALDCLDRCVRSGFDSVELLALADMDRSNEGRRRATHQQYAALRPYLLAPRWSETFEEVEIRVQMAIASRSNAEF